MMKQIPYAFHFVTAKTHPVEMDEMMFHIARCTHNTPIAMLTAIIHNRLLVHLFKQDANTPIDRDALLSEYLTLAKQYEAQPRYHAGEQENRFVSETIKKLIEQREQVKLNRFYAHETILDTYTVNVANKNAKT